MDPEKEDAFHHALAVQGKRLYELEQMLSNLGPGVQSLLEQLQALALQTNQILTHAQPGSTFSFVSSLCCFYAALSCIFG